MKPVLSNTPTLKRPNRWRSSINRERIPNLVDAINEKLQGPFDELFDSRGRQICGTGYNSDGQAWIRYEDGKISIKAFLVRGFDPAINRRATLLCPSRIRKISVEHIAKVVWRYRTAQIARYFEQKKERRIAAVDEMHALVTVAKKAEQDARDNPTPENIAAEEQAVKIALDYAAAMELQYPELFRDAIEGAA